MVVPDHRAMAAPEDSHRAKRERGGRVGVDAGHGVALYGPVVSGDSDDANQARCAAGVVDAVVPDRHVSCGLGDVDTGIQVGVEPVVFDQVPGPAVELYGDAEPADVAMSDRQVRPALCLDAAGGARWTRRQAADPEAVAVDGHVVGGDGDGVAAADASRKVFPQAPHTLARDHRRQAGDESTAVVVAFRGARPPGAWGKTEKQ